MFGDNICFSYMFSSNNFIVFFENHNDIGSNPQKETLSGGIQRGVKP